MAELATIARPYAEALFNLAKSQDIVEWETMLTKIEQLFLNPDIKALVHSRSLSHQKIIEILLRLFESFSPKLAKNEVKNLIAMLIKNGRPTVLPEITKQFRVLKNTQEGVADAEITSAFEMTESQKNELVASLEKKFDRKLNPFITVDNSLIGGVRVVVNDEVLDISISARLREMRDALVI
jgi:F-type H+-transporting ATPase subunit delta